MTNVVLFDFTNGPDQKAIPVRTELNPKQPERDVADGCSQKVSNSGADYADKNIMSPALLEASVTPASIRSPVRGELISGTSEIPLRMVYSPSTSGLPVVKLGAAT